MGYSKVNVHDLEPAGPGGVIRFVRRELDEVRAFLGRFREEDAVVGEDPDRKAVDPREAADERLSVERFELVEAAPVDNPGDHLARVEGLPVVARDQAVELSRVGGGLLSRDQVPRQVFGRQVQVPRDLPDERQRVLVRGRVMVGDA